MHSVSPVPHADPHMPPEQTKPAEHALPHASQFALSVLVFAQ